MDDTRLIFIFIKIIKLAWIQYWPSLLCVALQLAERLLKGLSPQLQAIKCAWIARGMDGRTDGRASRWVFFEFYWPHAEVTQNVGLAENMPRT